MNNYDRIPRNYTMLADSYEFKMAYSYFLRNNTDEGVFDVFFRKVPNDGGYAIMAGLDKTIEYIKNLRFDEEELNHLREYGYNEDFIDYLRNFKFTGDVYAIADGSVVFPNEPLVTVKAPLIQAQIIETALLAIINGAMEHATGARRIIESTPKGVSVMEFGARRADGCEAAIDSSIYGVMAGCAGTSNVIAAKMIGTKALGTMAHSYIESFDTEYEAFKEFASTYPENATLLVDTYDTLRSGIPNAIKTFEYMKENNIPIDNIGIRIDSGDLAYLSKKAREMLDEAGFENAKICLSNGLTASAIESLVNQGAIFNSLGVGDNISKPEGRMGCVYKLVAIIRDNEIIAKAKLSNDTIKIVNPDFKRVYRAYNKDTNYAIADIITRRDEKISTEDLIIVNLKDFLKSIKIYNFYLKELQLPIFKEGELVYDEPSLKEKIAYCNSEMESIYPEIKRIIKPQTYYVDGTVEYVNFKKNMILELRNKARGQE